MRLWSLHPCYLDAKGLVALWRETLLAQAVLAGKTVGYKKHPQLERFRAAGSPLGAISFYLKGVHAESLARGYTFDQKKISIPGAKARLKVTDGQLKFERAHLLNKLKVRDPKLATVLRAERALRPHPSFLVIRGARANWEKGGPQEA